MNEDFKSKINILALDDSRVARAIITEALADYNVDVVATANEATALMKSKFYAIILLDINLEDENGIEFCKKIRSSISPKSKIIFLTASNRKQDLIDGFNSGGNDYLTKPFEKEELICRLDNQIQIIQLTEQLVAQEKVQALKSAAVTYNHEINNYLSVISLGIYKIKKSSLVEEELVEKMEKALKRTTSFLKGLMNLTSVEEDSYHDDTSMIRVEHDEESKVG